MEINTLPVIYAAICVLTLTAVMLKHKCLFRGIFSSAAQGIAALYAVKLIGLVTGTQFAVNWYTLGTAAVLGSPGVALIVSLQTLFNT